MRIFDIIAKKRDRGELTKEEIENLKDDFHVADAIYEEVDKGFYIQGE